MKSVNARLDTMFRILGILITAGVLVSQAACSNQNSETAKLVQTVSLSKPPMQTAWRPDGKRFLADGFGSLAVWDTATGRQIATPPMWVSSPSVLYSPNGKLLVLSQSVGVTRTTSVLLLDAQDHHVVREFTNKYFLVEHGKAFSPDSRLLVVVADKKNGYRNVAAVLDVEAGTVVAELKTPHTDPKAKGEDFIERMVFSTDGATVMIGFITGKIDVWSTKDWQLIKTFKAHKANIRSMAISPNGRWLATGSQSGGEGGHYDRDTGITTVTKYDDPIKIWDTTTWTQVKALPTHDKTPSSLAFLPDGKHLVSANEEQILFWDVQTEKQVGVIKGEFKGGSALNFALSQDGQYLVVGGMGSLEVQVWKIVGQLNK